MSDNMQTMADQSFSLIDTWMAKNEVFEFPATATSEGQRRKDRMKNHWDRATKFFWSDSDTNSWFDKILALHSESDRAYHTMVHLEEMIGFLEILEKKFSASDYAMLVLAIFFHDAIYNPKSSTNEKDSATLFQNFCNEKGNCEGAEDLESQVVATILATQSHKASPDNTWLGFLLDLDMAVLAKESHAYLTYAGLIRQEYKFVERVVYCEKRAEILESFLEQPRVFCTGAFHKALETRARQNLKNEIDMLKKGAIPGEVA